MRGTRDTAAPQKPQGCSRGGGRLSRVALGGFIPATVGLSPCTAPVCSVPPQLGVGSPHGSSSGNRVLSLLSLPQQGRDGGTGRAQGAGATRGSASRRHMGTRCPGRTLSPSTLAAPRVCHSPRRGQRQGDTEGAVSWQGHSWPRPAGARPQERDEGMLQTLGPRPPPPPHPALISWQGDRAVTGTLSCSPRTPRRSLSCQGAGGDTRTRSSGRGCPLCQWLRFVLWGSWGNS